MNFDIRSLEHLKAYAVSLSLDFVGAVVILVIGWLVAGWVERLVRHALDRARPMDATVKPFIAAAARWAIMAFVLVAVLAQFGVQTASIIAALGTVGLAIGLALQGTLSNIAAGLMLLVLRPFRLGEYVDAEGIGGTVREIGLFATELQTFDGVYLHVPNGTLLSRSIKNFSRNPTRRIDIEVGVSYADDVDKALAVGKSILEQENRLLSDPPPEVAVVKLADSTVNINLRLWVKAGDYWNVLTDLNKRIKLRFDAEGLSIPFPQQDVHIVERRTE